MAGLPLFVTNRAKEVLDNLESKELTPYEIKKERLKKLKSDNDNQIGLFEFKDDELRTAINKMELDKITFFMIEALNKLNELKNKMKKEDEQN
jgi:DNA mismatch repair protein MutS